MASPATITATARLQLTIETDTAGLTAPQVVERFQKFFEFYHAAFNVKVKATAVAVTPVAPPATNLSVLD